MTSKALIAAALSLLLATPAFAERPARPGPVDSRIRSVAYAERDVVRINGHYGFTTSIELHPTETIQTVSIGDSEAWQVVKPAQPNLLFVKPIDHQGDTNMTIVTDRRIYNFMLFARQAQRHDSPGLTFHVKFRYPSDEAAAIAYQAGEATRLASLGASPSGIPPENWNFEYGFSGSERLRPVRAFDDGRFTYFAFSDVGTTPAIFLVDEEGAEQLVNYTTRGRYVVVERLGRQFTLRDGNIHTCIFNQAFPSREFDAGAPVLLSKDGQRIGESTLTLAQGAGETDR
ncbi:MAG: P-type conjugative transfer protein VirB9 [Pseudomonadota bacterium]